MNESDGDDTRNEVLACPLLPVLIVIEAPVLNVTTRGSFGTAAPVTVFFSVAVRVAVSPYSGSVIVKVIAVLYITVIVAEFEVLEPPSEGLPSLPVVERVNGPLWVEEVV